MSEAIALAGGPTGSAHLRDRLDSEARTLEPGWWPRLPVTGGSVGTGAPLTSDDGVAAFHVLTNSLPHTQSGYTLRSHAVLTAQRDAGIRVEAATRLAYPVSIGVLHARHCDTVDGIAYRRAIPVRTARHAEDRAQQTAELLLPHVERFRPHVLHTTTNFANALVTRALAERLGVPWVYEVRGLLEETWVAGRPTAAERERADRSERHRLLRARETEMARAADAVVTLSATLRDELVDRGVPAGTITVVPNGVDTELLTRRSSPSAARHVVGLPGEGFWVGTVSSLVDYEGLDTLIDAVVELRRRGVDARALVVGDGVSRPHLERRAALAGLGAHAVFTGRVPRHLAPDHHEALDVFVVPRRDLQVCRKVTPSKPLEAMAVGRPVVVSDVPALAELVEPHGSGRVVPRATSARSPTASRSCTVHPSCGRVSPRRGGPSPPPGHGRPRARSTAGCTRI
ncbi:glycosyltransferase [Cellulomonas sp. ATA003]|uniref:glycosyltransferase n=1 Tax=Cellulomonas sp. ATA003 TaxID=3073064 RepID=UPI0028731B66|nr:glycosyltransferase [Cellulomonas sp. ATA003]WNB85187.1 glycosyltransferase [Cellulomonas sp. ATA003]